MKFKGPLSSLKRVHLMGICGVGMASLAGLLQARGLEVTGSDENVYPPMSLFLEKLGISIQKGYAANNLVESKPDMVIVGNVISANNPEAQALLKSSIPYLSFPQALAEFFIEDRESLVVAGTHGKTTTSSLLAWLGESLFPEEVSFLIGGIPLNFSKSFRSCAGKYFVVEGDEYDTAFFDKVPKFLHYRPRHVILTSIEFDHADIYKDLNHVKEQFQRLISFLPRDGVLIYNGHDPHIPSLLPALSQDTSSSSVSSSSSGSRAFSYGLSTSTQREKVDYSICAVKEKTGKEGFSSFELFFQGKSLGIFSLSLFGDYNLMNAGSVLALAHQLEWDLGKCQQALSAFKGVQRRQEILGEVDGILVLEDFAHHPTSVKKTIQNVQDRYASREGMGAKRGRVFSLFEPRSATSCRSVFQEEYFHSFKQAQHVWVKEAFKKKDLKEEERFSSEKLCEELRAVGVDAHCFQEVDKIISLFCEELRSGDVVLIMSNGSFDGLPQKLLQFLKTRQR